MLAKGQKKTVIFFFSLDKDCVIGIEREKEKKREKNKVWYNDDNWTLIIG